MLEALSIQVNVNGVLKVSITSREESAALSEALQSLPNEYLSCLSQLESIVFNFSASVVKCAFEY